MREETIHTINPSTDANERDALNSVRTRSIRSRIAPNSKVSKSVVGNKDLFKKFHVKMETGSQEHTGSSPSDRLRFANLQKNVQKAIDKSQQAGQLQM